MPELPEVEAYRLLAEEVVGRTVAEILAPDAWYLKGGLTAETLAAALVALTITGVRRVGKLLLLDTGDGLTLGLRFGMSGRLLVDDTDPDLGRWDRFAIRFAHGGSLRVRDPRRLGGVSLDPDESRLGPDALSITLGDLGRALAGSRAALKARLLDQARMAGVGNLLADEALWRAGLDPARPAGDLSRAELRRLHRHLRQTVVDSLSQGGSRAGRLDPERRPGGRCPKDGAPLARRTVGGRTTWSCPQHQR